VPVSLWLARHRNDGRGRRQCEPQVTNIPEQAESWGWRSRCAHAAYVLRAHVRRKNGIDRAMPKQTRRAGVLTVHAASRRTLSERLSALGIGTHTVRIPLNAKQRFAQFMTVIPSRAPKLPSRPIDRGRRVQMRLQLPLAQSAGSGRPSCPQGAGAGAPPQRDRQHRAVADV